jgi:hypothetical protein
MKSPVLPPNLVWAIALGLISSLNFSTLTQASTVTETLTTHNTTPPQALRPESVLMADRPPIVGAPGGRRGGGGAHYKPPKPPGTAGTPGGRPRGGASRGSCPKVEPPLTILIPSSQVAQAQNGATATSVWGLSTSEKPTFWFFMPYDNSTNFSAEFVLQDIEGNDIHRQVVVLPKQAGVVGVDLPDSVAPLKPGVLYQTYLTVKCGSNRPSQSEFVKGWVQRTTLSPELANQIAAAKPQDRPAIYASNGLWFDALTTIAELRLQQPNDATLLAEWQSLLESVNLGDVANQPLVKP